MRWFCQTAFRALHPVPASGIMAFPAFPSMGARLAGNGHRRRVTKDQDHTICCGNGGKTGHLARLQTLEAWAGVRPLAERLQQEGFRVYLVGGALRDLLLGKVPGDMDLLTDAGPEEIRPLFHGRRVRVVGKQFPVCLVDGVEMASCRSGKRGAFPDEDLGMRDLTLNSMALDPFTGDLVDSFGGEADLRNRVIRFTRNPEARIMEDPLRLVRACRFAAALDGKIDPLSLAAIEAHTHLLARETAPERIQAELFKAMAMAAPSRFFGLLHDTGLLEQILPCLDRCHGLDGGPHHGETVFEHCMLVGDALPARRPLLRLAGFIHDAGKYDAAVLKDGGLTFAGHETHHRAIARDLTALRFSREDSGYILSLVRSHMRPLNQDSTPKAVRRLLAMLDGLSLEYRDFLRLRIADKKGNLAKQPYTLSEIRVRLGKILAELDTPFTINSLAITGREICRLMNIPPGPRVGQVKEALFEQVLADPSLNTPECLADLVRKNRP